EHEPAICISPRQRAGIAIDSQNGSRDLGALLLQNQIPCLLAFAAFHTLENPQAPYIGSFDVRHLVIDSSNRANWQPFATGDIRSVEYSILQSQLQHRRVAVELQADTVVFTSSLVRYLLILSTPH